MIAGPLLDIKTTSQWNKCWFFSGKNCLRVLERYMHAKQDQLSVKLYRRPSSFAFSHMFLAVVMSRWWRPIAGLTSRLHAKSWCSSREKNPMALQMGLARTSWVVGDRTFYDPIFITPEILWWTRPAPFGLAVLAIPAIPRPTRFNQKLPTTHQNRFNCQTSPQLSFREMTREKTYQ